MGELSYRKIVVATMPMYEYKCEDCGAGFEQLRRMSEADTDLRCPRCESERVKRLFSAFATSGCGSPGSRFT